MNSSQLAEKMLEWERLQRSADALAKEIQEAVLELGKTQTVGNVRASYSKGRKSVDYQRAAESAHVRDDIVRLYTVPKVDWKKVCESGDVSPETLEVFTSVSAAKVSLKIL